MALLVFGLAAGAGANLYAGTHSVDEPEVGKAAPSFTATDTEGVSHSLSDFRGKFVVLEWLNFGCPFVRKHYDTGNMQALQRRYLDKDVVWLSVVTTAEGAMPEGETVAASVAERNGAPTAILLDEGGALGRTYDARTTPHMYIVDPEGTLRYMGAIDDRPTTEKEDVEGATNYVAEALDAAMAGEDITVSLTKPYGCNVKY
jgi:peroxiredoxin